METIIGNHALTGYDDSLRHLQSTTEDMNTQVLSLVAMLGESIKTSGSDLKEKANSEDKIVNKFQDEINALIHDIILKYTPSTTELNFLIGHLMVASSLERIGDLAKHAIKTSQKSSEPIPEAIKKGLLDLLKSTEHLIRYAAEQAIQFDADKIQSIKNTEKTINNSFIVLFKSIRREIKESPDLVKRDLNLLFVAKNMERIADHAYNIASIATKNYKRETKIASAS